jgi:iron(III) transport system permease protein
LAALQTSALRLAFVITPFLAVMSLGPLVAVVAASLGPGPIASLQIWALVITGQASPLLPNWNMELSWALLWLPLLRSVFVGGVATILSLVIGGTLAWLVSSSNLRFKGIISAFQLLQLALPAFTLSAFWLGATRGLNLPLQSAYGPFPMILVLAVHFQSLVFFIVRDAFEKLDRRFIEAAQSCRAGPAQTFRRVQLPLAIPALLGSTSLVMFFSLSAFAPLVLLTGGSEPYYTLPTQLYSLYVASGLHGVNAAVASVLGLVLASVAVPAFLAYNLLLRKARGYQTVSEGGGPWIVPLRAARHPVSILSLVFTGGSVLLPLAFLTELGLSADSTSLPSAFSMLPLASILTRPAILLSLTNSFLLSAIVATLAVGIGFAGAYALLRCRYPFVQRTVFALMVLPMLLPGIAVGLAYLTMVLARVEILGVSWSGSYLYGTLPLAVAAVAAVNLPLTLHPISAGLMRIDTSLEEMAWVSGASLLARVRYVLGPLLRGSLLVAWVLGFLFALKELDVLMFLYAPLALQGDFPLGQWGRAPPIMYVAFSMLNASDHPGLVAQGALLLVIVSFAVLAVLLLVRRLVPGGEGWLSPALPKMRETGAQRRRTPYRRQSPSRLVVGGSGATRPAYRAEWARNPLHIRERSHCGAEQSVQSITLGRHRPGHDRQLTFAVGPLDRKGTKGVPNPK